MMSFTKYSKERVGRHGAPSRTITTTTTTRQVSRRQMAACLLKVVLDASLSMKGRKFRAAARAILRIIDQLPAGSLVAFMTFADSCKVWLQPLPKDRAKLQFQECIASIEADFERYSGCTALYDAMVASNEQLRAGRSLRPRGMHTFTLIATDGKDNRSTRSFDDVKERTILHPGVSDHHTILIHDGQCHKFVALKKEAGLTIQTLNIIDFEGGSADSLEGAFAVAKNSIMMSLTTTERRVVSTAPGLPASGGGAFALGPMAASLPEASPGGRHQGPRLGAGSFYEKLRALVAPLGARGMAAAALPRKFSSTYGFDISVRPGERLKDVLEKAQARGFVRLRHEGKPMFVVAA